MSQLPTRPRGRVPDFEPIRAGRRRGRHRLRRLVRVRRRSLAAGLAVSAAALVATVPRGGEPGGGSTESVPVPAGQTRPGPERAPERERATVSVPVRIADAATVRLVRPGDRVDVIAAPTGRGEGSARVVARRARVERVPGADEAGGSTGALLLLAVERRTAADLAGAAMASRLAVTLC